MKMFLKAMQAKVLWLAIMAVLLAAGATGAHAVPPAEISRNLGSQTFTGLCCFSWGETIKIVEPGPPVPVVVSWSADYAANRGFFVKLSVNGAPCQAYGPASLPNTNNNGHLTEQSRTFHWIVFPGEGLPGTQLRKGANTITLCGGGQFTNDQSVTLSRNTLSARISE